MVSRKGDTKHYPLDVTTAWLSWLAQQMRTHHQTVFFLEQIQSDWLAPRQRGSYRWSAVLVSALLIGLLVGLGGALDGALLIGLFDKLVSWPIGAQGGALLVGLLGASLGLQKKIEPAEALAWSWKGLASGLLFGLVGAPLTGLFDGLLVGLLAGLRFGLGATMQHYLLRCWLRHTFPLHAIPFLEDATARILLRRVGGGYSFTHRLLLDYFATLNPGASSSPSLSSPPPSTL